MQHRIRSPLLAAWFVLTGAVVASAQSSGEQVFEEKGIRIGFSIETARRGADGSPELVAGDLAEVRFRVTDLETGAPVSPLEPAVWVTRKNPSEDITCRDRIGRYLQGMISFQADVDLNKYFLLIMNNDQSISVVDPLLGVSGITQLYAMVLLKDSGEDWARGPDGKLLYVTMPEAGEVAVVNLDDFDVVENVLAGANPVTIVLQPDGRYLWVGNDGEGAESGVTIVDVVGRTIAGFVPTGSGHHEITFTDDSLFAFVTNSEDNTLSVVDTQRHVEVVEIAFDSMPVAVQFSSLSEAVYAAEVDGTINVIDAASWRVTKEIATARGLVAFRLEPQGRWGFAANLKTDRVDVVDVARGVIQRSFEVESQPHQFAFTDTYAYVRHLGTSEVTLIPLSQLDGRERVAIQKVAIGSKAPGEYPYHAMADAISPTGEWTAVVAANPADRMVYYYMEGMIAPMGSYTTYGRIPRAVGIVDRSVRETERGVYSAKFRIPASGDYSVDFLMDSPFVDNCFSFAAAPDPDRLAEAELNPLRLEYLDPARETLVGEPLSLVFSLTRTLDESPVENERVIVHATRLPGTWQERQRAEPLGDGRYRVDVPADAPGAYYVTVAVPNLGLDFTELPPFSFRATERRVAVEEGR